jgi:hypothetical protein
MLPVIPTGNGLRLIAGALPLTVLIALFGLLAVAALILPADRRAYVLELAPHIVGAIEKIAGQPSPARSSPAPRSR